MPIWFAAIPFLLGAARVAVPIAIRSAGTLGRTGGTIVRHRAPLTTVASTSFMAHDGLDVTRRGLVTTGVDKLLGSGGSKSSSGQNRKSTSGRPSHASRNDYVDPRQGGYRPNNRPGGYMPRF